MGWPLQRAYLDGLESDGLVKFSGGGDEGFPAASAGGPQVRKGVDAGTDVIDIGAMRRQLEQRGGG